MRSRDIPTAVITIALVTSWLSLASAHAVTVNGPSTLVVSASSGVLNLDLSVDGNLYFDAGAFSGDSLILNADVGVNIYDGTNLWPHAPAGSLNLDDSDTITVNGDVRIQSDAGWENSTARLASTGSIFVNSSGLVVNELKISSGQSVHIATRVSIRDLGTFEPSNTSGAPSLGSEAGALIVVGRGVDPRIFGKIEGSPAGEFVSPTGSVVFNSPTWGSFIELNVQTLEVSSVPLPGSLVLFGLGLAGLTRVRVAIRPSS